MTALKSINSFIVLHRFTLLLASLFSFFLIAGFCQHSPWEDELFLANICLIVAASLYAVEKITHHFISFIAAGIVAVIGNSIGYFVPGQEADLLAAAFSLVFMTAMIFMLFLYIFSKHDANFNTIIGAVCLFVMIGIAFGFIYQLIDYFAPNSFHYQTHAVASGMDAFLDRFFYYSFTTMTTLGYGDITPLSPPTRYVSTFEALTGQLYLTILMARLVGLHLTKEKN